MAKYKLLGYGSVGTDVEEMQKALNATSNGYNLATDGIYGEKTKAAALTGSSTGYGYDTHNYTKSEIEAMQQLAGIAVDGIWGPETQRAYEAGYTKDGTKGTKEFWEKLLPEDQYNPVGVHSVGPYRMYVLTEILKSGLSEEEKFFLVDMIGATKEEYEHAKSMLTT